MNSRPLKLAIVTPHHSSTQVGGAEYQIQCLIDVLAQTGNYDISYLARNTDQQYDSSQYRVIKVEGPAALLRLGYAMDALPLYRALKLLRPDVIYQRVACGYTGICAFYARTAPARMIWHVAHDTDVMPGARLDGRNPLRRFIEESALEYGIGHATHIVTQTERQAALLKQNYQRVAEAVIPNFHPEPQQELDKSGPLRVLWVANLKPWKQPDAFVRLARAMADMHAVRFVMIGAAPIGSGDRMWAKDIRMSIEATANLDYLGERTQEEINQQLARAHVFVNTSVHEGFPNTFIQAWMREVPVVSLHVDPDGVLDREAIGFHAHTESNMAAKVMQLLTESSLRLQFAKRARQYALRAHSLRNVEQLAQLIETGKSPSRGNPDNGEQRAVLPNVAIKH